jgi:hypothetical protein
MLFKLLALMQVGLYSWALRGACRLLCMFILRDKQVRYAAYVYTEIFILFCTILQRSYLYDYCENASFSS